jgi:hypothetical protein
VVVVSLRDPKGNTEPSEHAAAPQRQADPQMKIEPHDNLAARQRHGDPQVQQVKAEPAKQSEKTNDGNYSVETVRSGAITAVQVTFRQLPSSTDEASKIVRKELQKAVAKDASREILAMAFNSNGDALPDETYGGALTYKPDSKSIMTMDQRRGLKATSSDNGDYFVTVAEDKTFEGIEPARKWVTCQLVFADPPSGEKFKEAALAEIAKLKDRQLDITLYAYAGDKSNSITWQQCRADNGRYMKLEYEAKSGSSRTNW